MIGNSIDRPGFLSIAEERAEVELTGENIEAVGNEKFFASIGPVSRKLRAQIASLADIDTPVFFWGEPGSGRKTAARLLHTLSVRSGFSFAQVNCGALPEDLLERATFGITGIAGHTGLKAGKLEICRQGTFLLEEITEMPLRLQRRLLQTLHGAQCSKGEGSNGREARLVAASCVPLDQAVAERKLDPDLAILFGAYELRVPALRERKEEVPLLARHCMYRLAMRYGLPLRELTPVAVEAWQEHGWPGNLRELEQAAKRYLVAGGTGLEFEKNLSDGIDEQQQVIAAGLFSVNAAAASLHPPGGTWGYKSLKELLQSVKEEAEKAAISFALEKTSWNRKAAARLLKTSYRSLLYKIEQYQMNAPGFSSFAGTTGHGPKHAEFRQNQHEEMSVAALSRTENGR